MHTTLPSPSSTLQRLRRLAGLLSCLLLAPLAAQAAEVAILTAGAYKPVLLTVQSALEQRTGHTLRIVNDTAGGITRRLAAGESWDLIVSTPASLKAAQDAERFEAPARPLARVGIGVAVRQGAPVPAIATVEQLKAALLAAPAVAMVDPAAGGTSGVYLFRLYDQWGIGEAMRAKASLTPGGLAAERLLDGRATIALQQASELKAVAGVQVIGGLPPEIQLWTVYAGAVPRATAQAAAARELLQLLQDGSMAAVLDGKGMEMPR